jgi:hypothetical protein
MKPLVKYLFAAVLFMPQRLPAQASNEGLVEWSSSRKLTWNDYNAPPDLGSGAAASTTTYLGIEYNFTNNNFSFKITSNFSKDRSWGLHKTDYILSHEQGHFDIAELFARKLNKAMNAYVFNKNTFQQDLKKIYESVLKEKEKMQNEYDDETNHSIKKGKQAEWLVKIAKELDEYQAYANYNNKPGVIATGVVESGKTKNAAKTRNRP